MNRKYPLLLLFLLSTPIYSQNLVKECFDSMGKPVDEANSEYCIIGKKISRVKEYSIGKLHVYDTVKNYVDTVRAYYSGADLRIKFLKIYNKDGYEDGDFVECYPNGKIKERGVYKQGNKIGYVTVFYLSGKQSSVLQFFPPEQKITDFAGTNFKIISCSDSTGKRTVKNGNGFCACRLQSGRIETGKVVDGLRDSIWSEYEGRTLIFQEQYSKGKFLEGVSYYHGVAWKYTVQEEIPSYIEGYGGMMEVIRKNIRYPVDARRRGVDGTVFISFMVKEDGTIDNLKIAKGFDEECDREALRVVRLLKNWYPARLRGKPVSTQFNLPITFKLG